MVRGREKAEGLAWMPLPLIIIVLDGGVVVERGRHAELIERDGLYARMWRLQQEVADDRDVAGVAYVFLRGVTGEPDAGVHVLRPSRALVDALEAELFAPLPDA